MANKIKSGGRIRAGRSKSENAAPVLISPSSPRRTIPEGQIITSTYGKSRLFERDPDFLKVHKDPFIYDEMMAYPDVSKSVRTKLDIIYSAQWGVIPHKNFKNDTIHLGYCDYLIDNFENVSMPVKSELRLKMTQDISDILYDIHLYRNYQGRGIAEKKWGKYGDNSQYRGLPRLEKFQTVPPNQIGFRTDKNRDLESVHYSDIIVGNSNTAYLGKKIDDPSRLVYFINGFINNWHGVSDLKYAYLPWFSLKHIERMYRIFFQTRAFPPVKSFHEISEEDNPAFEDYKSALKALHEDGYIDIPQEDGKKLFDFDSIDLGKSSGDQFLRAIVHYGTKILHALLMPDTFMATPEVGTQNKSIEDAENLYNIVQKERMAMGYMMTNQVISDFVEFNIRTPKTVIEYPPMFVLRPPEGIQQDKADMAVKLGAAGFFHKNAAGQIDEPWIREWIGIPENTSAISPEAKVAIAPAVARKYGVGWNFKENMALPKVYERVDFKMAEDFFNSKEDQYRKVMLDEMNYQKSAFKELINRKGILDGTPNGLKEIDSLTMNVGELKKEILRMKLEFYCQGKLQMFQETEKADPEAIKNKFKNLHFNEKILNDKEFDITKEFVKNWIKKWKINFTKQDQLALERIVQDSKRIAGAIKTEIVEKAKQIILDEARLGVKTPGQILDDVLDVFSPYIKTGSNDGSSPEPYRIDNIIRTQSSKEFNAGRINLVTDPELAGVYAAAQYASVIDGTPGIDGTTEFCRKHNKQIIAISDADFLINTPPNHYGCRSFWVFILKTEDYKITWTATPERPGFKYFIVSDPLLFSLMMGCVYGTGNYEN